MTRPAMTGPLSALVLALSACQGTIPSSTQVERLVMTDHTPTLVAGTYASSAGGHVAFRVEEVAAGQVQMSFDLEAGSINITYDYNQGVGSFGAGFETLSLWQRITLVELDRALDAVLPADWNKRTRVEDAADRATNLAGEIPVDVALDPFEFQSQRDVDYIPCECAYRYLGKDVWGRSVYHIAGQGWDCADGGWNGPGKPCKGRCGEGCDGGNLVGGVLGTGVYSQDCGRHDYTGSYWDFIRASDDYFAAPNCLADIGPNPYQ